MKKAIIPMLLISGIVVSGITINKYQQEQRNQQLIDRIMQSEYNPRSLIQTKLEEINKQNQYDEMIETKKQEIINYKNSYEYKLREETRSWREPLRINTNQLQPINAELSFYSSLACENGIYGLKTASGVDMSSITVANNFLPFGTQIYIEGHGLKKVEDTGSKKYFTSYDKFDVYVPRNPGESDSDYYKRVNNLGRKTVQAYIIKE